MNKRITLALTLINFLLMFLFIITPLISNTIIPQNKKLTNSKTQFISEKDYFNHIKKNVEFENLNFTEVTIKRGDNFWKIAKKHGVNIDTLIGANPFWESITAKIDQKIIVPSKKGVLQFIKDFDDLKHVYSIYKTDEKNIEIQELPPFYKYYCWMFSDNEPIAIFIKNRKPVTYNMTDRLARQYSLREKFRSPLGGRFSSFFGRRRHPIFRTRGFHNGIDIAARYGTVVGASREGRVISTGWMGGYGKTVIISHPDGYKTLYGHLSRILVRKGKYVKSGSLIGRVGSTGWSTGPHLHFTLWHWKKLINPMKILW